MYGYRGIILRVDLTHETIARQLLDPAFAKDYLGGRGFNSKTLFDEIGSGTDPLGPDNVICFAPGPLSGTRLGMTSRVHVSTLSPYSGILGDGNAGEKFAAAMKKRKKNTRQCSPNTTKPGATIRQAAFPPKRRSATTGCRQWPRPWPTWDSARRGTARFFGR